MARHAVTALVLVVAAAFAMLSALGIVRSKNALAALHALGVASVMLPPLVMLAVLVDTGLGVSSVKTICFVTVLLLGGPISSHAVAVAAHRRRTK